MDDRYSEDIVLSTPGGFVGRSRWDPTDTYPIVEGDIKQTFENLYPKRPNFNMYTECSSRGTCDYATGQCKCFDGFEGRGCRRTTCPNACSGHGRCLSNMDVNSQYYSFNYPNDQMWDQMRTQVCKCDRGYTGYDCNSRICPFGDDPTSDCGENSAGDVQLVVSQSSTDPPVVGGSAKYYFTLTFTDMFGGAFTTRPILDQKCELEDNKPTPCPEIQYALMDLPNFAIPEVEVDVLEVKADTGAKTKTSMYSVQFTHSSNSGKQNTLQCEIVADSDVDGAQPKYQGVGKCEVYNVGGPEWFNEAGTELELDLASMGLAKKKMSDILANVADMRTTYEDFQPCSSKGDCDAATGTCTCNAGHYGEACEKQSTYY